MIAGGPQLIDPAPWACLEKAQAPVLGSGMQFNTARTAAGFHGLESSMRLRHFFPPAPQEAFHAMRSSTFHDART